MLSDIRYIFDRRPTVDRLTSAVIVADLYEMPHGLWSEWRGPRDDQTPRRLSQGAGAHAIAIRHPSQDDLAAATRHTRPVGEGLHRKQFEAAWAAYCEGTPAQHGNVRYLDIAHG